MKRDGAYWSEVSLLRPGDRIVVSVDAEGVTAWVNHLVLMDVPGSVTLAAAEVESVEQVPGTGDPGEAITTATGGRVYTPGKAPSFVVRLTRDGVALQTEVEGDLRAHGLKEHHQVCGGCGELWPCRDLRIGVQAERLTWELDDQCAHCGNPIGSKYSITVFDGLARHRYHQAQRFRANGKRCRDAAAEAQARIAGVP